MVEFLVNNDGTCSTCKTAVNERHVVECFCCKKKYHGECDNKGIYCTKSFLKNFKGLQNNLNFMFVCPPCLTAHENVEASTTKQQLAEVVAAVAQLTQEVRELKAEKSATQPSDTEKDIAMNNGKPEGSVWNDHKRLKKVKDKGVTLCIKSSDGRPVDKSEVEELVTSNGIQVSKASVSRKNGDMYIDLPSEESRDKLTPLC